MFRPEQCSLAVDGAAPATHNTVSAVLERSLFQGSTFEHVLRVADKLIVAIAIGGERHPHGENLTVSFPKARTMIFPLAQG